MTSNQAFGCHLNARGLGRRSPARSSQCKNIFHFTRAASASPGVKMPGLRGKGWSQIGRMLHLMAQRADERRCYACRYLHLVRSDGIPGFEPSSEFTILEQLVSSVSDRLDRLDGNDPAAIPLREHLGELTARRDLLMRSELNSSRVAHIARLIVSLFTVLLGTVATLGALIDLTSPRPQSGHVDVGGLVTGVLLLLGGIWLTVATWSDMWENRRMRAEAQS